MAVDFLTKSLVRVSCRLPWCLSPDCVLQTFDPKKRITVEEALCHPYLEAYVSHPHFLGFSI